VSVAVTDRVTSTDPHAADCLFIGLWSRNAIFRLHS